MKFKPIIKNKRQRQSFDLGFKIKQRGQEFCLYDKIQESREDTELYTVLEKYNCIPKHFMDPEKIYADFRGIGSLQDIKMQQIEAQKLWESLPHDVRKEFNNDKYLFAKEGEKYLKKKIDAMAPKTPVEQQPSVPSGEVAQTTNTSTGGNL